VSYKDAELDTLRECVRLLWRMSAEERDRVLYYLRVRHDNEVESARRDVATKTLTSRSEDSPFGCPPNVVATDRSQGLPANDEAAQKEEGK
jgi:hypothetical protein